MNGQAKSVRPLALIWRLPPMVQVFKERIAVDHRVLTIDRSSSIKLLIDGSYVHTFIRDTM